jgi:hypothetical protein
LVNPYSCTRAVSVSPFVVGGVVSAVEAIMRRDAQFQVGDPRTQAPTALSWNAAARRDRRDSLFIIVMVGCFYSIVFLSCDVSWWSRHLKSQIPKPNPSSTSMYAPVYQRTSLRNERPLQEQQARLSAYVKVKGYGWFLQLKTVGRPRRFGT